MGDTVTDFEELMETLEIISDPEAMKALEIAQTGKAKYRVLDLDDPDFGL